MEPHEFEELGARLFMRPGAETTFGWQARAAAHFRVNDRTVRKWISGRNPVPEGVARELRAMIAILPPPESTTTDDDRDDAMRDVLDSALDRLASEYRRAGWHDAEVYVAILAYSVERLSDDGDAASTIATLEEAIAALRARASDAPAA